MVVKFTWKTADLNGQSFTIEHKDGTMRCLETGLSIKKDEEYFKFFTDTMAQFADIEFLEL